MLILGIETRHRAGRLRHRRPRGRAGVVALGRGAAATPRTSTPAIEFVCRQARVELSEICVVAVDLGPGLFTGLRVGVAAGQGDRPRAAGADDRRVEPRPAGLPGALHHPR